MVNFWNRCHIKERTLISLIRLVSTRSDPHCLLIVVGRTSIRLTESDTHLMIGSVAFYPRFLASKDLYEPVMIRSLTSHHPFLKMLNPHWTCVVRSLGCHRQFIEMPSSVSACHEPSVHTRSPIRRCHSISSNVMHPTTRERVMYCRLYKTETTKAHYEMGDGAVTTIWSSLFIKFFCHGPLLAISSSVPSSIHMLISMLVFVP